MIINPLSPAGLHDNVAMKSKRGQSNSEDNSQQDYYRKHPVDGYLFHLTDFNKVFFNIPGWYYHVSNHKEMLKGFRDFILRGNVIDLAVAVVIGSAFGTIVTALVKDIINPLLGAIGGTRDFSNIFFTINGSKFMVGDFLNTLISFLIIATIIYFLVVLPMNTIQKRLKNGEKVDPTEKTCPECLSQIPFKASRCKYCTAVFKKGR